MRRFVDVPGVDGREPSTELLGQVRFIDPTAEVVYVGDGRWWLGTVRPNEIRRAAGARICEMESKRGVNANPRNVLLGRLLQQGFARVEEYRCDGDPATAECKDSQGFACSMAEDFRERDFNWRQDEGEKAFAAKLDISSGEQRKREQAALMRDWLMTDGRAEFRRVSRQRVTFGG